MASSFLANNLSNVVDGVLTAVVLVVIVWFRDLLVFRGALVGRWVNATVTHRGYVLLWIDDGLGRGRGLVRELREGGPQRAIYRAIESPREVLYFPRNAKRTKAIVLLDTDVTKLADEAKLQEQIESRLKDYVEKGGGIVGSHDLIYRRVRAPELQTTFGGKITSYATLEKDEPVAYAKKPDAEHPVTEGLPATFELHDGEICWGEWDDDVQALCATADDTHRPLVVARKYAEGRVVWLNSGDKGRSGLCRSIAAPETYFLMLLRNSVGWVSRT